jgi:hypothetical protein
MSLALYSMRAFTCGMIGLTLYSALQCASDGILVSSIGCPGDYQVLANRSVGFDCQKGSQMAHFQVNTTFSWAFFRLFLSAIVTAAIAIIDADHNNVKRD